METLGASAGILLIVAVAALFGWVLSVEGVPQKHDRGDAVDLDQPLVLLGLVNVLLLVVGMFLDSTTAILVIAPIIAKPLMAAGVDPVHLGMVVVFNLMIGLLTPPMGLALFLVADIAKVKMKEVLREMLPFYVPLGVTLLLITYVPAITTWLPRWRWAGLRPACRPRGQASTMSLNAAAGADSSRPRRHTRCTSGTRSGSPKGSRVGVLL